MTDNIERTLGRIETKLDSIADNQKLHYDRMNRIDMDIKEVTKRVNLIENRQYGLMAKVTLIASIGAVIIGAIIRKVVSIL